jgi:hypothetical protein
MEPMADALVLPPGGEALTIRGGSTLLFKAVAATTGGSFSLHERRIPVGGRRPPAHSHPDRVEAFWMLDGEAEFELATPSREHELRLMRRHGMQPVA